MDVLLLFEEDDISVLDTSESDSSEDSEVEGILAHCIKIDRQSIHNYFEETVLLRYSDEEFIRHYRINKQVFAELVERYENTEEYQRLLKYHVNTAVNADKTIAVFLWFAGHEACSF